MCGLCAMLLHPRCCNNEVNMEDVTSVLLNVNAFHFWNWPCIALAFFLVPLGFVVVLSLSPSYV